MSSPSELIFFVNGKKLKIFPLSCEQAPVQPSLCDVPAELNVHLLVKAENPHAIYLSKGIGEPPVFFGSTILFAIKSAIAAEDPHVLSGPVHSDGFISDRRDFDTVVHRYLISFGPQEERSALVYNNGLLSMALVSTVTLQVFVQKI